MLSRGSSHLNLLSVVYRQGKGHLARAETKAVHLGEQPVLAHTHGLQRLLHTLCHRERSAHAHTCASHTFTYSKHTVTGGLVRTSRPPRGQRPRVCPCLVSGWSPCNSTTADLGQQPGNLHRTGSGQLQQASLALTDWSTHTHVHRALVQTCYPDPETQ